MSEDAWDNFWWAGTAFSTDDGIHDGLTRKPYRRTPEPSHEQILMEQHPEITPEQAKRIVALMEDWDRERRYSRREYD